VNRAAFADPTGNTACYRVDRQRRVVPGVNREHPPDLRSERNGKRPVYRRAENGAAAPVWDSGPNGAAVASSRPADSRERRLRSGDATPTAALLTPPLNDPRPNHPRFSHGINTTR
jgi:hypothetical protein